MTDESHRLSDVVLFEIPTCTNVEILSDRIRPRWAGWAALDGDAWLVAARLADDGSDLAALLREVEAYVAASGLQAIRYHLDGRVHIMGAPAVELAHAA
jgi:hypothetical protein